MARVDTDLGKVLHLLPSVHPRRIPPVWAPEPYDYAARLRWRNRVMEERRLDFRFDVTRLIRENMAARARELGIPWSGDRDDTA